MCPYWHAWHQIIVHPTSTRNHHRALRVASRASAPPRGQLHDWPCWLGDMGSLAWHAMDLIAGRKIRLSVCVNDCGGRATEKGRNSSLEHRRRSTPLVSRFWQALRSSPTTKKSRSSHLLAAEVRQQNQQIRHVGYAVTVAVTIGTAAKRCEQRKEVRHIDFAVAVEVTGHSSSSSACDSDLVNEHALVTGRRVIRKREDMAR